MLRRRPTARSPLIGLTSNLCPSCVRTSRPERLVQPPKTVLSTTNELLAMSTKTLAVRRIAPRFSNSRARPAQSVKSWGRSRCASGVEPTLSACVQAESSTREILAPPAMRQAPPRSSPTDRTKPSGVKTSRYGRSSAGGWGSPSVPRPQAIGPPRVRALAPMPS